VTWAFRLATTSVEVGCGLLVSLAGGSGVRVSVGAGGGMVAEAGGGRVSGGDEGVEVRGAGLGDPQAASMAIISSEMAARLRMGKLMGAGIFMPPNPGWYSAKYIPRPAFRTWKT
jgi:hypothetical protein